LHDEVGCRKLPFDINLGLRTVEGAFQMDSLAVSMLPQPAFGVGGFYDGMPSRFKTSLYLSSPCVVGVAPWLAACPDSALGSALSPWPLGPRAILRRKASKGVSSEGAPASVASSAFLSGGSIESRRGLSSSCSRMDSPLPTFGTIIGEGEEGRAEGDNEAPIAEGPLLVSAG
jgi:hypothetical protein